jgi:myo-inositol catabolism protein IolC
MTESDPNARGALLLCAFDHRDHFERMAAEHATGGHSPFAMVALAKELVLEAVLAVRDRTPAMFRTGLGVFVDEQFGAHVAVRARAQGLVLAMPAERSSAPEFAYEFGERFAAHIESFDPHLVKVLVRHNPDGDPDLLARQAKRLRELSDWCREANRQLLLELLVPPLPEQQGPGYVARQRLRLTFRAVERLAVEGIRPAVWKVEAPADPADLPRLLAACRATDPAVHVVVLGGGAAVDATVEAITASAGAGYDGFAVGRTIWAEPLAAWFAGRSSGEAAVAEMAANYESCIAAYRDGVAHGPVDVPA